MMSKVALSAVALAVLLGVGIVVAQTTGTTTTAPATSTTATAPGTSAAAKPEKADKAVEDKFAAADKDKNGVLDGAETDAWKADLAKIDTDKDGKVSKAEHAAAAKAGVIQ